MTCLSAAFCNAYVSKRLFLYSSSDLGEEDKRQYKDEDLPGTAAEGSVRHPSTVGCVKHDPSAPHLPPSAQSPTHPTTPLTTVSIVGASELSLTCCLFLFIIYTASKQFSMAKNIFLLFPQKLNASTVTVVLYTTDCSPQLFVTMWHVLESS